MWNGLYATGTIWNPRQPQDLVKGVKDNQSVRDARPLPPNTFVGPVWTTTTEALPVGGVCIPLDSLATFQIGDQVAIMIDRDGGTMFYSYVVNVGAVQMLNNPTPLLNEDGSPLLNEDGTPLMSEGTREVVGIIIGNVLPSSVSDGAQVWNFGPLAGAPQPLLGTQDNEVIVTEDGQEIALW